MARPRITIDGNEAAAYVAYKTNEVIAIYPITPSSNMGEWSDEWAAKHDKNIWGVVPTVKEMQSEGGAAGAVHGALQAGSLTTTFTASQGLLLMIPNMFKIAGELTSTVFHIAARSIATHALSIFGDHSDVMSTRSCGWAMLSSNNVQEVMDLALIAQAATLESRVPFIHFFDGFRISHELSKIEKLTDEDIRAMIDDDLVNAHRQRALNPEHPVMRGTAQNPDVFFQAREACNPYYAATPAIVQKAMDKFASIVGRQYKLFDYVGAPDAERVVIAMGSGCETVEETVEALVAKGEKVGVLKVRLYRPFSPEDMIAAIPATVKSLVVLDRTKEPGGLGEPLYQDVMTAYAERYNDTGILPPKIIGGRYGLSSKEFTPAMAKAVLDEPLKAQPKNHFTVGIDDDVSHTSLEVPEFHVEMNDVTRAMFWGLGADGTVGANKNSIKIIGEDTDNYAQGYFVYDSKKSGAATTSHLRFGPRPIKAHYLIQKANFIAVHQSNFIERYDVLGAAAQDGVFLLNTPFSADEVWDQMPKTVQEHIINKNLRFFVINAYDVAKKTNMGVRINTIMQTCFFAISGVLPREEAIEHIKKSIKKTYGKRGDAIVAQNFAAVDAALEYMHQVKVPNAASSKIAMRAAVPANAPEFVKGLTAEIIAGRGDACPVSMMPVDGTFPTGTTQWERRNIALDVPVWDPSTCIQCGKCSLVCPHGVIRSKVVSDAELVGAPEGFQTTAAKWKEFDGKKYTLAVSVEDCTGCGLCVNYCPAKNKSNVSLKAINMTPLADVREKGMADWDFFKSLPATDRSSGLRFNMTKNLQLLEPYFEFSGACSGCGETPYVKVVSQMFGDRMIVANATGCSSIYGGNLPTTPWCQDKDGRGPAWSNSLFEDNAEFGLGMRLAVDQQRGYAVSLLTKLQDKLGAELVDAIVNADQSSEEGIAAQRERVAAVKAKITACDCADCTNLLAVLDQMVKRSVWIFGGDGWAYDIGYGGLDHVLASGLNVNVMVLDTEVYSNTGGQASKATPFGAVAKFASGGKETGKKDLGLMQSIYGNVYVAQIAMGANEGQALRAIQEAEAYEGPSLIIAYSHCIAHGIDMGNGLAQQKLAVDCGYWPLWRYNPSLVAEGKNPFVLDSGDPKIALKDYISTEGRYKILMKSNPEAAAALAKLSQAAVTERLKHFKMLAAAPGSAEQA
ncbi:MAG: pyruvate:ferredoxin (flavodoxin) oxidoreductase [Armatimonadota bacterium]